MKELKLTITHIKILHTIKFLNEQKLYPNQEGIFKILSGEKDEETESLMNCPTFGSLISYSSKKVCHYILALNRYGFVAKIFDRESKELYLTLTERGDLELFNYLRKHKNGYSKKKKNLKKTIVKID